MPVFNIAANTWRQPSYLDNKQQRAGIALAEAQTAGVEKKTELAEDELAVEQEKAATAAKSAETAVKKYLRDLGEDKSIATQDAAAAAQVIIDDGGEEEEYMEAWNAVMENSGFPEGSAIESGEVMPPNIIKAIVDGHADEYRKRETARQAKEPKTPINLMGPEGEKVAIIPGTPEMQEAIDSGFVVAGTSNDFLGLGESSSEIDASDESFILRMVGTHFGGLWDEESEIMRFMDKTVKRSSSEITALATNYFSRGGSTRADSVKKAMKQYGEKWEEPEHEIGDIIEKNNKKWEVTGFDEDGEPLVREVG